MLSTKEVLGVLAEANPDDRVDEERVRRAIRTGRAPSPSTVAGRFVWNDADIGALAQALGLHAPDLHQGGRAR